MTGSRAPGPAGTLVRRGAADFLDEKCVDAAARIEPRDPGEAAVEDEPHAVDRERGFGHVRGDDRLALLVRREGGVLLARGEVAVERERDETVAHAGSADGGERAVDLVFPGHENQRVALRGRRQPREFVGG